VCGIDPLLGRDFETNIATTDVAVAQWKIVIDYSFTLTPVSLALSTVHLERITGESYTNSSPLQAGVKQRTHAPLDQYNFDVKVSSCCPMWFISKVYAGELCFVCKVN
jgi:hypothetical protein